MEPSTNLSGSERRQPQQESHSDKKKQHLQERRSVELDYHPIQSILQKTDSSNGRNVGKTQLSAKELSSALVSGSATKSVAHSQSRRLTCNRQLFLCAPDFLELKYVINPWMDLSAAFTVDKAKQQWEELVDLYKKLVPDSVFTVPAKENLTELCFLGDSVFAYKNKAVFGRFATEERFPETEYVMDYFLRKGIEGKRVPEGMHFEGSGETMVWNGKILVGYGKRNSEEIVEFLRKEFDVPVIGFDLIDPEFYHLDTAMFPISNELIAVYEDAFSEDSKEKIKSLGCEIMYLSYKDAKEFALNSIVIDRHVIVHYEAENFIRQLQERGFIVHPVDVSEFIKFGGGLKCLTFQHYLNA